MEIHCMVQWNSLYIIFFLLQNTDSIFISILLHTNIHTNSQIHAHKPTRLYHCSQRSYAPTHAYVHIKVCVAGCAWWVKVCKIKFKGYTNLTIITSKLAFKAFSFCLLLCFMKMTWINNNITFYYLRVLSPFLEFWFLLLPLQCHVIQHLPLWIVPLA